MSANTNYFIWRFFGILLYPLYALWCHIHYRKRPYHLTCLVNDLSNCSDIHARGQIAHRILKLIYRDYGVKEKRNLFDMAAINYLTHHAPWLAIRCNLDERKVVIATREGDLLLCEEWQYYYMPDVTYIDKGFKEINEYVRRLSKELRVQQEMEKKTMALLIYFIMLNIMRRP